MIEASVILCTHNGAATLPQVLASLVRQRTDYARFELLIVDNASTDDTAQVVHDYLGHLPNARYLIEPSIGLSRARNLGVTEAEGSVVAFIDDDVVLSPNWMAAMMEAMADGSAAAIGGRILPVWPHDRPSWLSERCEAYYGRLDLGPEPCPMSFPYHPFGGNMAIRSSVLRSIGGFATALGRCGHSRISNEEKELFGRLHQAGGRMFYAPDATVRHIVRSDHVTRRWLCTRALAQGRSDRLAQSLTGSEVGPAGVRLVYAMGHALLGGKRWLFANMAQGWERALVDEVVRLHELVGLWVLPVVAVAGEVETVAETPGRPR